MRRPDEAFTLLELLVAIAVLVALVLFVERLFSSAAVVTTSGNKRLDIEGQTRPLFERIAVDFSQMVKRSDTDFFGKNTASPNSAGGSMAGNDSIAFYSTVAGYYPSTGSQSPVSLIAYRVNAQNKLERVARGLLWNGVSPTHTPVVFLPATIAGSWPSATDLTARPTPDPDTDSIAPYVFRFEYYYLLKNGSLSVTPWDTSAGHTSVNGLRDVAAVSIAIAAIDPKSSLLMSDSQLATLVARLPDFAVSMQPGALLSQWQTALAGTTDVPRTAIQSIRVYERYFYLSPK
jgi:prepilin-type N-terminal cleavage/methylation domain-containing protein